MIAYIGILIVDLLKEGCVGDAKNIKQIFVAEEAPFCAL